MQFEFYIAVYGTLMEGERNFQKLPRQEINVIEHCLTDEAIFQMAINPSTSTVGQMTPSVSFQENGHRLYVQIMNVTKSGLIEMDRIENVGENYDRVPVKVEGYPTCEIYIKRDASKGVIESPHRVYDSQKNSLRWCANP